MKRTFNQAVRSVIRVTERFFFTGVLILVPVYLTIFIFYFALRLFHRWLSPLHAYLPQSLQYIPYLEVVFLLAFIVIVGAVVNIFFLHSTIEMLEKLVRKVPLVSQIYSGLKQLVGAFTNKDKQGFQQVVLVEFPHPGMYSIGFLTGDTAPQLQPRQGEFYNVFVPTTPNPTTGYFLIVPKNEVIITSLTRQDGMAIIMSGGIIQPEQ